MEDHRRHLARGFNWLGGATIIAKVVDVSTMLAVLLFLTKQQLGVSALVISVGMIVEAFDGLGTSEALTQAGQVPKATLDTLFWFVVGSATAMGALTLLAAPMIASVYGVPGMAVAFVPIALKQPLVGAALIPLALMNKALQYERIAVVNVCASLAAAATRLGLAVLGAGVWAPVAGYASSGLFVLLGASVAGSFRPGWQFRIRAITPLLRFGLRATASNVFEQVFKNVDFLLVGWFYGAARLAVYRVAFDLAMEPAMAVGTLVNRTALPVFVRVAGSPDQLSQALTWSLGRIAILVAPLMGGLILAADPLTALLHDGRGGSYAAAALPLKLLAAAALLRIVTQLLYPLMMGSGRPGMAARLSALTLLLLSLGILVAGWRFRGQSGIVAVSAVWLCVTPLVLGWGVVMLSRRWQVRPRELARSLAAPAVGLGCMVGVVEAARLVVGVIGPRLDLGIVAMASVLTYAALLARARTGRV